VQRRVAKHGSDGAEFEKVVEHTFVGYEDQNVARLAMMPPPTAPTKDGSVRRLSGTPPFDVYGFLGSGVAGRGLFVGAEIKFTRNPDRSLPIIMPGKSKGHGIQFHQLESLYAVVEARGVARLIWGNGGMIGVLTESGIANAYLSADAAQKAEQKGMTPPKGAKSIPWSNFRAAPDNARIGPDWLLVDDLRNRL